MSKYETVHRIEARFFGRVQGVGFRFTTVSLAQKHVVQGYVKNEWDGSVLLIAEGSEPALRGVLAEIHASRLCRYITDEQISWTHPTGGFSGFSVRP